MDSTRLHFGIFELAPDTGKLAREGVPVRLQPQPAKVLALLVRRAGEVITREDLRREVWGDGTHVDFDRGLNFCIAQIRTALGDSAESPRYLQTIPKQGYRFIAPVRPAKPASTASRLTVSGRLKPASTAAGHRSIRCGGAGCRHSRVRRQSGIRASSDGRCDPVLRRDGTAKPRRDSGRPGRYARGASSYT